MLCCLLSAVSLVVQSNTPVVIGSVATFHAALYNLNHSRVLNKGFLYIWINNAANCSTGYFDVTTTAAGTTANMSKVFSVHQLPGRYLMEVRVFRIPDVQLMAFRQLRPIAVGFHNFTLTGTSDVLLFCWYYLYVFIECQSYSPPLVFCGIILQFRCSDMNLFWMSKVVVTFFTNTVKYIFYF